MEEIDVTYRRASESYLAGGVAEAEVLGRRVLNSDPGHAGANHLVGLIALGRGGHAEAVELIGRAVEVDPRQPMYHYNLGLALRAVGQLDAALGAYDQAVGLNPDFIEAQINRGITLRDLGREEEALAVYEDVLRQAPERPMVRFNLGNTLSSLGRAEEALAAYEQVLRLEPGFAPAHNNRANVLRSLDRREEALSACEKALRLDPGNAEAYNNYGSLLSELGRHAEALAAYERALVVNPHYVEAHNNRGNALRGLGRPEEALQAYGEAIRINPGFATAYSHQGDTLMELGRLEEACKALYTALEHNPELVNAKYFLAAMGAEEAPSRCPEEYVINVFDSCADEFDSRLVDSLKYQVPQLLFEAVSECRDSGTDKLDILDLGCGTGLCGVAFSEVIKRMVGVDLAPRMLGKAGERGVYTELIQADVCQVLEQCAQSFNLVLSADVFIYIGDLEEVFGLTARRLCPGGLFAFSIEVDDRIPAFELRPTGRYVQSPAYIDRLAQACGFEEIYRQTIIVRYERGKPVAGSLIVLRLSA